MLYQSTSEPLRRRVTIGLPAYGQYDPRTVIGLMSLTAKLEKESIPWRIASVAQNPYFGRVMNEIVHQFLTVLADDRFSDRLMLIDSDIAFRAEDAVRLIMTQSQCVGADYRLKDDSGRMASGRECRAPVMAHLQATERMGTGFLCLGRPLLERMIAAHPETAYIPGPEAPHAGETTYSLFDNERVDGHWLAEDVVFFRRLHAAGGVALIDTSIKVGHIGTHVYEDLS